MPAFYDCHNVVVAPAAIGLILTIVQFGENKAQTAFARDDHLLDAIYRHKGQRFCRTTACAALIRRRSIYIKPNIRRTGSNKKKKMQKSSRSSDKNK